MHPYDKQPQPQPQQQPSPTQQEQQQQQQQQQQQRSILEEHPFPPPPSEVLRLQQQQQQQQQRSILEEHPFLPPPSEVLRLQQRHPPRYPEPTRPSIREISLPDYDVFEDLAPHRPVLDEPIVFDGPDDVISTSFTREPSPTLKQFPPAKPEKPPFSVRKGPSEEKPPFSMKRGASFSFRRDEGIRGDAALKLPSLKFRRQSSFSNWTRKSSFIKMRKGGGGGGVSSGGSYSHVTPTLVPDSPSKIPRAVGYVPRGNSTYVPLDDRNSTREKKRLNRERKRRARERLSQEQDAVVRQQRRDQYASSSQERLEAIRSAARLRQAPEQEDDDQGEQEDDDQREQEDDDQREQEDDDQREQEDDDQREQEEDDQREQEDDDQRYVMGKPGEILRAEAYWGNLGRRDACPNRGEVMWGYWGRGREDREAGGSEDGGEGE
ncbi:hypothetical protein FHG87_021115 [Trinorchestia longiramus]|nr:hypothetical protein FHG87_021115 [Trinorchestia longiramus]